MMTMERDWSGYFWAAMLPVCWVLAPVLAIVAQNQAWSMNADRDRSFQSALYLSVFLAMFGLVAIRMLIARALDHHHLRQAIMLGLLSLTCSAVMIAYGLSAAY